MRFITANADIIEFESKGSHAPDRRAGELVDVRYAADRPTHAMIDRVVWDWCLPAALVLRAVPVAVLSARRLIRG